MDHSAMVNDGAYQSPNTAPYNLAEIWPFPINIGESGAGFDLRRVQLGQVLGQFTEKANLNREVTGDGDPIVLDHRVTRSFGSRKRRDSGPQDESSTGNGTEQNDCEGKRVKTVGSGDENVDSKAEAEGNWSKSVEQNAKPVAEPPKQDYIHVRARRGQATDSHSLAERARREKISERMKILQDLVPGCNKVIGKAVVLDEIINYIQSLQRQVEFLSMKLEAVNSRTSPGNEGFLSKEYGQQTFDATGLAIGSQATRDYERASSPEWLHMQIGGGFERTTQFR